MPVPIIQRATLRDVAVATGYSLMTVSRALRGLPGVSAERRSQVQAAANRLGYRPDPVMSALAAHRQRIREPTQRSVVAFLTHFATAETWKNLPEIHPYFDGAVHRGAELGYQVENFWLREPGLCRERASQILFNRGIEGLLLPPFPFAMIRAHLKLRWERFAAVAFENWLAKPSLHTVVADYHDAGRQACHQLRKAGFRRIGLAMWYGASARSTHTLLDAFLGEQARHPTTGSLEPLLWEHFIDTDFPAWFRSQKPDVILTNGPGELPEAVAALPRTVWRQTPIVYAGLKETDPLDWPGVRFNLAEAGRVAMDHLHGMLLRRELGLPSLPISIALKGTWRDPKNLICFVLGGLIGGLIFSATPNAFSQNLIRNGSFEGSLLYWHDHKEKQIAQGGKNGPHPFQINQGWTLSAPIPMERDASYTISLWVRSLEGNSRLSIGMPPTAREVAVKANRIWKRGATQDFDVTPKWQRVSATFKADVPRHGFWPLPHYGVFLGVPDKHSPILIDGVTVVQGTEGTADYLPRATVEVLAEPTNLPGYRGAAGNMYQKSATATLNGHLHSPVTIELDLDLAAGHELVFRTEMPNPNNATNITLRERTLERPGAP